MQAHPPLAGGCAQVSRDAPLPLPGGYRLGEKVFFTGLLSKTWDNGDKVVHGQQGEVVGPAPTERTKGKGVRVLFPGNKGSVACILNEVRRLRAASAATPAPVLHTRDAAHDAISARPPAPCVCPGAPTPTASVAGSGKAS